jgi:hypothetical protein
MAEIRTPFEATPQQVEEWKEKFGKVFEINVTDDRSIPMQPYRMYVKKPSRQTLEKAGGLAGSNGVVFMRKIYEEIKLQGDKEIEQDDYLFNAAIAQVGDTIKVAEASIKEL